MEIKKLFNKLKIKVFTITLSSSLIFTGCTVDYKEKNPEKEITSVVGEAVSGLAGEVIKEKYNEYSKECKEYLARTVSEANLDSEEEIKVTADSIRSISRDYAEKNNIEFESATLVRVVDGDTIVVEINDKEEKVRLIGINTPESVASEEYLKEKNIENTEEGINASHFVKGLLDGVDTVYLQKDTSDRDKYGRLLRYVWLKIPEDITKEAISEYMLNGILVRTGYAEPVAYKPDTEYNEEFNEIKENYHEY